MTDNNLASKTAETTDTRETQLSLNATTAPVLTTAESYETRTQKLKRMQDEMRHEADAAVDSLKSRLTALAVEAAEMAQTDAFSKEMRQALSQLSAATDSSLRILSTVKA